MTYGMLTAMRKIAIYTTLIVCCAYISTLSVVGAIEYAGIGAQPANPREGEPKSVNIFIHTLESGAVQDDAITLINSTDEEKEITVDAVDSINASGGGFGCAQKSNTQREVGTWITLEKSETSIPPQSVETIPMIIQVPAGTSPGEYNGCIAIEEKLPAKKSSNSGGLTFSTRIGIRVALTVPGKFSRKLTSPTAEMNKKEDGGIALNVTVENESVTSIDTEVSARMRSLFFGLLHQEVGGRFPLFRERKKGFGFLFEKPFWGGPYVIITDFSYDSNNDGEIDAKTKAKNIYTFVMPDWGALAIEIGVVILFFITFIFIVRARNKRKRREKRREMQRARRIQQREKYRKDSANDVRKKI